METAISLPDDLFSAADALAEHLGVSRNQLYAAALAEFLSKHAERQITGLLDQVYGSEDGGLDNDVHRVQRQPLGPDEW